LSKKSNFADRILKIIGDDKPYSWALRNGIAKSSIHNVLKTGRPPGADQLLKISQAANVTVDWLLTGEKGNKTSSYDKKHKHSKATTSVPIINHLTAQKGAELNSYTTLPFSTKWLSEFTASPKKLSIIIQCSDTMEPTIIDGDFLLIDTSINQVAHDSIYAISSDNGYNVRRMQKNIDNSIAIRCDNDRYGQQVLPKEEIEELEILGKVIMIFHRI
jgi:phage repressor protein C with HTH and peptisase S24 domain